MAATTPTSAASCAPRTASASSALQCVPRSRLVRTLCCRPRHVELGLTLRRACLQLSAKQVARFHASYTIMQKAHMDALKQRLKEKTKPASKGSASATPA